MKSILIKAVAFCCIGIILPLQAQHKQKLPETENLVTGKLKNGLRYYIKNTSNQGNTIALRFFVKAGHLQEDEDQMQTAHLVEHLAFKPTPNFPQGIISPDELVSMGMLRGALNGNTAINSTRYVFNAPKNNTKAVTKGLKWFKDIAVDLSFSKENIAAEKGSIRQELMFRKSDNVVLENATRELEARIFPHAKYEANMQAHIQALKTKAVRRFYTNWYRPDLMNVVIVGPIANVKVLEKKIETTFSDIPSKAHQPIAPDQSVYFKNDPKFVVKRVAAGLPNKNQALHYNLYYRVPYLMGKISSKKGYKDYLKFELFLEILQERLKKIPNLMVKNEYRYSLKPFSFSIQADTKPTASKGLLEGITTKLQQLIRYGITNQEFQEVLTRYLQQRAHGEKSYWLTQLSDHITKGHPIIENPQTITHWLKNMKVKEFNRTIKKLIRELPEDIAVIASEEVSPAYYTESTVRAFLKEGVKENIPRYVLPEKTKQLLTKEQKQALDVGKSTYRKSRIADNEELVLANGISVVLQLDQPSESAENNELSIQGFSCHGAACYPKEAYYSALMAPQLITKTGVGGFTSEQLNSFKEEHHLSPMRLFIDYQEAGVLANGNAYNMEALFQLLYTYFQPATYNEKRFCNWQQQQLENYNSSKAIEQKLKSAIREFHGDSAIEPTLGYRYAKGKQAYEAVTYTKGKQSVKIYNEVFGQPEKWTFIITGNVGKEQLLVLLQKYLGNVRQATHVQKCKIALQSKSALTEGPVFRKIYTDTEMENVKYNVHFFKPAGTKENIWKEDLSLQVLGELIDNELQSLRHQDNLSLYDVWADGNYNADENRYEINIDISCLPEELAVIRKKCSKITRQIIQGDINEKYFKEALKRVKQTYTLDALKRPRRMQRILYEHLRYDRDWVELSQYADYIEQLSINDIQQAAQKYMKPQQQYEFVLGNKENL